ncbi:MAG: hypothetical protein Q4G61_08630 [Tissierellia bacterium]|nr:hypothetical protein [Tissierellia bacterium]
MVKKVSKKDIKSIKNVRTGGQTALKGYSYQYLYTIYLILSEFREEVVFQLEGIEDIDMIEHNMRDSNGETLTTHIQLKYSKNQQDASFLKNVLKNFLEVYLIDGDRNFKLIYDFQLSRGNLSKLFNNKLDETANNYWKNIIQKIEDENSEWNWVNFDYDKFISKLSFEKKDRDELENSIEKLLISNFDITTDNISLYANSIKILCLNKMVSRGDITKRDIESNILEVQDDINRGSFNPAFNWIKKVDFVPKVSDEDDLGYYEGKKPTYQDIANQLPIRRESLLEEFKKSIIQNRVTIIKASSGQGKTTLALQVIYELYEEYTPYQLYLCNDRKDLINIVSYFETRVKLGEKPLILIDNLDAQLSDWNMLLQLFQEQIKYHYKFVVTTREEDWYAYKGDLTNLKSINIINIKLDEKDAKNIFDVLKENGMLHASVRDWKKPYRDIEKRKLLIEYIYLLTHGEMLSERINTQLAFLANSPNGKIKNDILRKVCFADICGAKILISNLLENIKDQTSQDPSELLKSLESEYFTV